MQEMMLIYYNWLDVNGNVVSMASPDVEHLFDYDSLGRLTDADHPEFVEPTNPDEVYTYDANNNRLTSASGRAYDNNGMPMTVGYSYDAASRLIEDDHFTYEYDPNGNTTRRVGKADGATVEYDYDSDDRLISVREWLWLQGGATGTGAATPTIFATYNYDPLGRRIEKIVNGAITRYAYDGDNLIAEYGAGGTLIASYTHPPGSIDHPLSMTRAGQTFHYVYDGNNNVVALTNEAGEVVQTYEYDAFGRPTLTTGQIENPFTYTGREYDPETGLYFYRARAYDPETGRFLQQDPVWDANLYAYANNNPVNLTDPMGTKSVGSSNDYYDDEFLPQNPAGSYQDEGGCLWSPAFTNQAEYTCWMNNCNGKVKCMTDENRVVADTTMALNSSRSGNKVDENGCCWKIKYVGGGFRDMALVCSNCGGGGAVLTAPMKPMGGGTKECGWVPSGYACEWTCDPRYKKNDIEMPENQWEENLCKVFRKCESSNNRYLQLVCYISYEPNWISGIIHGTSPMFANNNAVRSIYGPVDIDWMFTVLGASMGIPLAPNIVPLVDNEDIVYLIGKLTWSTFRDKKEYPHYTLPYEDPGERNAMRILNDYYDSFKKMSDSKLSSYFPGWQTWCD